MANQINVQEKYSNQFGGSKKLINYGYDNQSNQNNLENLDEGSKDLGSTTEFSSP